MQDSLVPPRARRSGARARAAETGTPRVRPALGAESTCSMRVIQPFGRYLAQLGCDCAAWLGHHGLTPAALNDRDLRVPHERATALLGEAIELSGDPAI